MKKFNIKEWQVKHLNENSGRDLYHKLRKKPPKLKVVKNAREVNLTLLDRDGNRFALKFIKKGDDFQLSADGWSIRNWDFGKKAKDLEWKADDGKWDEVFKIILKDIVIQDVSSR